MLIYYKMVALPIFSKICQIYISFDRNFLISQAPDPNPVYARLCFTKNDPLKMLLWHFLHFHCSNANMTFDKNFMK